MPTQAGRITVDELDVGACAFNDLAMRLSILPHVPEVALRLTVAELVAFGRYSQQKGRATTEDAEIVQSAIDVFCLGAFADRALDTLSGGR